MRASATRLHGCRKRRERRIVPQAFAHSGRRHEHRREHLDHYSGIEEIREAFAAFIGKVPFYGAAIVCLDDENIRQVFRRCIVASLRMGASEQADVRVTHSSAGHMASGFHLAAGDRDLGCFRLPVPGAHNVLNAAAAVAIGLELEIPLETIREALANFSGVERRFQVKGTTNGVTVVDDYGHHPTEIRATLSSARACRFAQVHVLFQPHRYTRTQALMDEFARAFDEAIPSTSAISTPRPKSRWKVSRRRP